MSKEDASILLVEDDDVDAEAFLRALRKCNVNARVHRVSSGSDALRTLSDDSGRRDSTAPVVFLDLNMPGMNGFEFLDSLRGAPELRGTVVFVLTTSSASRDKIAAYERNVAGYIVKPSDGRGFANIASLVEDFLGVVELPAPSGGGAGP